MQPDVTESRCLPLVVGYTWDGSRPIWTVSGLVSQQLAGLGPVAWDDIRHLAGGVYTGIGDFLAVIEALGVDAEQHFDAVPGPLGHPGRRHPSRQPKGNCRMTADRVAMIDWDESHVNVPDLDLALPHNAAGLDDDAYDIAAQARAAWEAAVCWDPSGTDLFAVDPFGCHWTEPLPETSANRTAGQLRTGLDGRNLATDQTAADGYRRATALALTCVVLSGGTNDNRARRREGSRRIGRWPPPGFTRRPRAGDRHSQGRVHSGTAVQRRAWLAGGPGARVADLRGAGCAHRRHSRRADRSGRP